MTRTLTVLISTIVVFTCAAFPQLVSDKILFTITLNDDSTSLFYCKWGGEIRSTLSGPVVAEGNQLLFYSEHGYALYDMKGALVESHTVFEENAGLKPLDPSRLRLAFPVGGSTVLYYREAPGEEKPIKMYAKRLLKKRLKEIKDEEYAKYPRVSTSVLFNLAHNVVTDEMAAKSYLKPQLVGFGTGKDDLQEWWTLDRFYTFSSPVLHLKKDKFGSFFPGIKSSASSSQEVKRQLVEPLAVFIFAGRWHYAGVYATLGTEDYEYEQKMYICDEAGNVLYADTLLKQANTDAVLGEDEANKTYYTVKKTARFVFQPVVDSRGNVYYGLIDYEAKKIDVHHRTYALYGKKAASPNYAHLFDLEEDFQYEPVVVTCGPAQGGAGIPNVTFTGKKGQRGKAIAKDLSRGDFIARIARPQYRDIEKKLARRRSPFSESVEAMRDSLYKMSTSGCPYSLSLTGPKGMHRSFDYDPGMQIVCARVIAAQKSGRVLVRVDLKEHAEILMFDFEGNFINRFVFNQQDYTKRADLVIATQEGDILERDYEFDGKGAYFTWQPVNPTAK